MGCLPPPAGESAYTAVRPPIAAARLPGAQAAAGGEIPPGERRMTLTNEGKLEIVRKFGRDEKDTGSAEVQIALLTTRINELTEHLAVSQEGSPLATRVAVAGRPPPPPAATTCSATISSPTAS